MLAARAVSIGENLWEFARGQPVPLGGIVRGIVQFTVHPHEGRGIEETAAVRAEGRAPLRRLVAWRSEICTWTWTKI